MEGFFIIKNFCSCKPPPFLQKSLATLLARLDSQQLVVKLQIADLPNLIL